MKRIVLMVLFVGITSVFAQNVNVQSAHNYKTRKQYDKAVAAIETAIEHVKTKDNAKTWSIRARIYIDLHVDYYSNKALASKMAKYKKLAKGALDKAYESANRCVELDEKKMYKNECMLVYFLASEQFYNRGSKRYNKQSFEKALPDFENAIKIYDIRIKKIDTASIYYASYCATKLKEYDKGLKYLKRLDGIKYKKPYIYADLANIYTIQEDTTNALKYIRKGAKIFPENLDFPKKEAEIYQKAKNYPKAIEVLTKVSTKEGDNNADLLNNIGFFYIKISEDSTTTKENVVVANEKAIEFNNKAIAVDSMHFDANFDLAFIYYNKAYYIMEEANGLDFGDNKYDGLIKEGEDLMKLSLPFWEKCHEIQPEKVTIIQRLVEVYTKMKKYEKAKEFKAKLEALNNMKGE